MCSRGRSWSWGPGAGSPITAVIGQRWLFLGDSITAFGWYEEAGGFLDQLESALGGAVDVSVSGLSGDQVIRLASNVHDRVAAYDPDVVVFQMGVNDVRVSTTTPVFRKAFDSVLYGIRAECPNAQILAMGIFIFGEQWASGPLRWAPTVDNALLDADNVEIAASCAVYGAAYADPRAAALLYEQANNTPEPGANSGILTPPGDTFHPNATGEILMGTTAMAQVVAS